MYLHDDDSGAPEVEIITTQRLRSVRGVRLNCGHTAAPGETYTRTVAKVDDDFSAETTCLWCEHGEDRPTV